MFLGIAVLGIAVLGIAVLGIDISKANFSKANFDATLLDGPNANNTSSKPRHKAFPNSQAGFERLQEWLGNALGETKVHACLEATNTYGDALARFLHEHGHTVSIVTLIKPQPLTQYLSRATACTALQTRTATRAVASAAAHCWAVWLFRRPLKRAFV